MAKYRTRDGHKVAIGSQVWAQNGTGPFTLMKPGPAYGTTPKDWVLVVDENGEAGLHAPEDISLYYYVSRPAPDWRL